MAWGKLCASYARTARKVIGSYSGLFMILEDLGHPHVTKHHIIPFRGTSWIGFFQTGFPLAQLVFHDANYKDSLRGTPNPAP